MNEKNKILVFDDHPLLREGVVSILKTREDFDVLGHGDCHKDAITLTKRLKPDTVLLDINMPGGGIEAARDILAISPDIKILMLTSSECEKDVMTALQIGAKAYILKGIGGIELINIIVKVTKGETYITPSLASSILGQSQRSNASWLEKLNPRENEVLKILAEGFTNKQIADELFLSEKTIKYYVSNILQKLQVKNRVEAALLAQKIFTH